MSLTTAALDPTTNDITWGKLTGDAAIEQTVRCALRFVLGEWFLDVTKGIPWYRNPNANATPIMGAMPADLAYAEAWIKSTILGVTGVSSIVEFSISLNHTTRAAACKVKVITVTGGTFTLSEQVP